MDMEDSDLVDAVGLDCRINQFGNKFTFEIL
jgi:hypothetical protein